MYAYTQNNPVMYSDISGEFAIAITTLIFYAAITAGVLAAGSTAYYTYQNTGEVDYYAAFLVGVGTALSVYSLGIIAYSAYTFAGAHYGFTTYYALSVGGASGGISMMTYSQYSQYMSHSAPPGGGGITYTTKSNGTSVDFGHGGRHLSGKPGPVYDSIASDLTNRNLTIGDYNRFDISVRGQNYTYGAYRISDNLYHVGTIFPKE